MAPPPVCRFPLLAGFVDTTVTLCRFIDGHFDLRGRCGKRRKGVRNCSNIMRNEIFGEHFIHDDADEKEKSEIDDISN